MKDEFENIGYTPIKQHILSNLDMYAYECAFEKKEDGFSPTRSLIHDLVGGLPEYKQFLNKMEDEYGKIEIKTPQFTYDFT